MKTTTILIATAVLLGPVLRAQEGESGTPAEATAPARDATARLDGLLEELARVPKAVWEARAARLTKEAEERVQEAARLRAQAAELVEKAGAEEAEAAALRARLEQLARLRELLAELAPKVEAAAKPAGAEAKSEAMAQSAPAKPESKAESKAESASTKPAAMPEGAPAKPASKATSMPEGEKSAPKPKDAKPKDAKPSQPDAAMSARTEGSEASVELLTYDDDVLPIFEENCITCHDPVDASGGLDLSSYAGVVQGGGSGRTLRPGNPDGSRLYLLVSHQERPTMPPDEPPIARDLIATIRTWIAQGAPEDSAHAARLAKERAAAAAAAKAQTAERAAANTAPAVMPEDLPPVEKRLPPNPPVLRSVAVSPVAPLLAVPGPGQVLLMHAGSLAEIGVLPVPFPDVEVLRFSADGTRLLAAGGAPGRSGAAVVFDVRTGAEVRRFEGAADAFLAAAISPDGATVALGGCLRRVDVLAVETGERRFRVEHDDWVLACAFSGDGELLATADRRGGVRVVEAATGRDVHELDGHDGAVHAVCFARGDELLVTAGADRSVRGFRMRDGREAWKQTRHRDAVLCVASDGRDRLVSADADGTLVMWRPDGGQDGRLPRLGEWVYGLAFAGDERLVACDWQGRVHAIDLASREVAARVEPWVIMP